MSNADQAKSEMRLRSVIKCLYREKGCERSDLYWIQNLEPDYVFSVRREVAMQAIRRATRRLELEMFAADRSNGSREERIGFWEDLIHEGVEALRDLYGDDPLDEKMDEFIDLVKSAT